MMDERIYGDCIIAEQAVIGDILAKPDIVMPEAIMCLTGKDFLSDDFSIAFQACTNLFRRKETIDAVTVSREASALAEKDYRAILFTAHQMAVSPSGYKEHIRLVSDNAKLNRAADIAVELMELVRIRSGVSDCAEKAGEILRCFQDNIQKQEVWAGDGFVEFMNRKNNPVSYIETGFHWVDINSCISPGDYVVVGGRPSSGKTALTLQMALRMAEHRVVAYFSLETSVDKVFDRLVACKTGTPLENVKLCENMNVDDWARIGGYGNAFFDLDLCVVPAAGWTVEQIRAKTIQVGAQVIFIDYLGLIRSRASSIYEKVTQISVDLHTMAQSLGVTVIALAQLNREGKNEPDMTSLRDSGQIEQDADILLLLDYHDGKMKESKGQTDLKRKLILAKNKDGMTGGTDMILNGPTQRFLEVDRRYS